MIGDCAAAIQRERELVERVRLFNASHGLTRRGACRCHRRRAPSCCRRLSRASSDDPHRLMRRRCKARRPQRCRLVEFHGCARRVKRVAAPLWRPERLVFAMQLLASVPQHWRPCAERRGGEAQRPKAAVDLVHTTLVGAATARSTTDKGSLLERAFVVVSVFSRFSLDLCLASRLAKPWRWLPCVPREHCATRNSRVERVKER
eukprot:Amastigsp_a340502_211.p3 type:complete len:204 gc:universal Amastigsp_a340502_211:651-40(-)